MKDLVAAVSLIAVIILMLIGLIVMVQKDGIALTILELSCLLIVGIIVSWSVERLIKWGGRK